MAVKRLGSDLSSFLDDQVSRFVCSNVCTCADHVVSLLIEIHLTQSQSEANAELNRARLK